MNTNTQYLSIAETDFGLMKASNQAELEDRLVMVICDPNLTAARITGLVKQQIARGVTDINERHFTPFESTIAALHQHGVLPALDGGHVTLDELIAVVNDPDALRLAHLAVVNDIDQTLEGEKGTIVEQCFDVAHLPADEFVTRAASHNWNPRVMNFSESLNGAPNDTPADVSDELIYTQYGKRINIDATRTEIPHGLCRMVLVDLSNESGLAMITKLPTLEWIDEHWFWENSIDDLFDRPMDGVEVRAMLIAADETNRVDFDTDEVRNFIQGLTDGPQKQYSSQYLFGSTNANG